MIAVQSVEQRHKLASAMIGGANALRISTAAISVVFAADTQAMQSLRDLQLLERRAGKGVRYLRSLETDLAAFSSFTGSSAEHALKGAAFHMLNTLGSQLPSVNSPEAWAFKNASFAAQTLMLAATAHGLSSCAMEGFNARAVRLVCGIPDRYGIPLIVSLGHAPSCTSTNGDEDGKQMAMSPRYDLSTAARLDTFNNPLTDSGTNET